MGGWVGWPGGGGGPGEMGIGQGGVCGGGGQGGRGWYVRSHSLKGCSKEHAPKPGRIGNLEKSCTGLEKSCHGMEKSGKMLEKKFNGLDFSPNLPLSKFSIVAAALLVQPLLDSPARATRSQ